MTDGAEEFDPHVEMMYLFQGAICQINRTLQGDRDTVDNLKREIDRLQKNLATTQASISLHIRLRDFYQEQVQAEMSARPDYGCLTRVHG